MTHQQTVPALRDDGLSVRDDDEDVDISNLSTLYKKFLTRRLSLPAKYVLSTVYKLTVKLSPTKFCSTLQCSAV